MAYHIAMDIGITPTVQKGNTTMSTILTSHNGKTVKHYKQFRASGMPAAYALRSSRTLSRFQELEYKGYVRVTCEEDQYPDTSWMDARQLADYVDGGEPAMLTRSEYRLPLPESFEYDDDEQGWILADSCGGHFGYRDVLDPFQNWYVIDEMAEALDQFDSATQQLADAIEKYGSAILAMGRREVVA